MIETETNLTRFVPCNENVALSATTVTVFAEKITAKRVEFVAMPSSRRSRNTGRKKADVPNSDEVTVNSRSVLYWARSSTGRAADS